MKNKKAISPLIATVLIIGFTIVLAAVVIQWGGVLVNGIIGKTDISSDVNFKCSSLSNLAYSGSVTKTATTISAVVDNKNDQIIEGFVFRVYKSDNSIDTKDTRTVTPSMGTTPLGSFSVGTYIVPYTLTGTPAPTLTQLGAIPIVKASDGKPYPCSSTEIKATIA